LLERNYRTPGRGGGEIDLVMRDRDGTLVFVEVRSRSSNAFGGAGASIGAIKQRRIVFAARHYLLRYAVAAAVPLRCVIEGQCWCRIRCRWLKARLRRPISAAPKRPAHHAGALQTTLCYKSYNNRRVSSGLMLEQRIQQHFIDSADLKYQAAQALSQPIAAAVQAILACVTSGGKVLACGNGPSAAEAQQFAAFCVAGFERDRPELAAWR
jgi:Holliday junction resolvase-like predicted endonuclease